MDILGALSLFLGASAALLGFFVLLRDAKSSTNRAFFYFSFISSLWIVAAALGGSLGNVGVSRAFIEADFELGLLAPLLFMYFSLTYRGLRWHTVQLLSIVLALISTATLLLLPEKVIQVKVSEAGSLLVSEGSLFLISYALPVLIMIASAVFIFFKKQSKVEKLRTSDNESRKIVRNSMLAASMLTAPNLFSSTLFTDRLVVDLLQLSANLGLLVFVGGVGYAVTKYKLFDLRWVLARSVAYVLAITSIVSVYLVLTSRVIEQSIGPTGSSGSAPIVLAILTIVSAIAFTPLKRVLDKFSDKVFYRDAYDLNAVVDDLSNISVSEYEVDSLIESSVSLLNSAIRPVWFKFILLNSDGEFYSDYVVNNPKHIGSIEAIDTLRLQSSQLFLTDEYQRGERDNQELYLNSRIFEYLDRVGVAVSVQLRSKDEVVGYMLFGPRLSGGTYSKKDRKLLGIASKEMAVAIQNARRFDEIKRFNETLKLEIDRATQELRQSNEKLQALDEAKNEFISMASHQLRTPLTSVKGYLSMVLEGDAGTVEKQQRDLLAAAFTSSQRMVYLIADLLNVSRLQTGKFVIEPILSDLPTVVESEIDQLKETARAKDLTVTFKKPKKFPQVYIDETKTRQVIMNFIDNAIYYTPTGGKIEVSLRAADKIIEYTVTDNGIGVPKAEQKNMFTKFYRATNAKKARPDGTGLGLFMAKKVIVDQGGALIFHSTEGEGSTFGFTFPLTRVRPPKQKKTTATKAKSTKKSSAKGKKQARTKSTKRRTTRSAK